jgi:general secretion pathway protein E
VSANPQAAPLSLSAPDPEVVRLLPYHFASAKGVIAARLHHDKGGDKIEVWLREGIAAEALAEARRTLGCPLDPKLLPLASFERELATVYARPDGATAKLVADLGANQTLLDLAQDLPEITDLLEAEDDAPIIRLINALITQALDRDASDIHIEAYASRSVVRLRIDGMLRPILEPQRALHAAIVSRIKIMADLDIAEKRMPQDGRITLKVAGRPVDVRVSTLPTGHGERVVLRLLDKTAGRLELSALGMSAPVLATLDRMIQEPHGIVLVTGPTGSGKTTTLYAALSRLDGIAQNMMTVEDPIEYELDGVAQTQVNHRIELSFARALRSILRQDPDVIMIGEIRDLETAQIAVQASLTGHLVLATLHTNDSASAVTRLIDMGVEPFLAASSVIGILAQRLVRKLCPHCAVAHTPDAAELKAISVAPPPQQIRTAPGCEKCGYTGFAGRTGIYELLNVDNQLRSMIHDGTSERAIRDYGHAHGMEGLREDGMRWVAEGTTSLEEVLRATRES